MDPNTGKIVEATPEQAEAQGLVPVTDAEALVLSAMSRTARQKWLAEKGRYILTASDHAAMTAAQAKRERKAAKRIAAKAP